MDKQIIVVINMANQQPVKTSQSNRALTLEKILIKRLKPKLSSLVYLSRSMKYELQRVPERIKKLA